MARLNLRSKKANEASWNRGILPSAVPSSPTGVWLFSSTFLISDTIPPAGKFQRRQSRAENPHSLRFQTNMTTVWDYGLTSALRLFGSWKYRTVARTGQIVRPDRRDRPTNTQATLTRTRFARDAGFTYRLRVPVSGAIGRPTSKLVVARAWLLLQLSAGAAARCLRDSLRFPGQPLTRTSGTWAARRSPNRSFNTAGFAKIPSICAYFPMPSSARV